MAEPIKLTGYDAELEYLGSSLYAAELRPSTDGEAYLVEDVSPLLRELAELRERARMRDAATEPPPIGVPVLALDRQGMDRWRTVTYDTDATGAVYRDERTNQVVRIVRWWPLPDVER